MVRAFGYCNDVIESGSPSRLCRGRERWLEGLPDAESNVVFRTVLSGATFTDDSARDALRGYRFAGVSAGVALAELFPGATVFAFCHTGDPIALPDALVLEEDWVEPLHGGVRVRPAVRWVCKAAGPVVDELLNGEIEGEPGPRAEGFVVVRGTEVSPELLDAIYHLSGFADATLTPQELYAASALPEVLEHALAVVLLHLDKHGPAFAIYTAERLDAEQTIRRVAREAGAFAVPFAIPPMLARWDRALYELRLDWDAETYGEFPVPPADDAGGRWSARSRRIGAMRDDGSEGEGESGPEGGANGPEGGEGGEEE